MLGAPKKKSLPMEGSCNTQAQRKLALARSYFCRLTDATFGVRRRIRNSTAFFSMR